MKSEINEINKVTNSSVHKHTQKNWDDWIRILNKYNAKNWTHKEIAQFLQKKYKLTQWWQHIVASGFEIHTGKKIEGRNAKGECSVTVTKTLPLDIKALWNYLNTQDGIKIWLNPMDEVKLNKNQQFEVDADNFGEIRSIAKEKRIRLKWVNLDWSKPSYVQLTLVKRKNQKCMLVIQQERIPDNRNKELMRDKWLKVIQKINESLSNI